MDATTSTSLLLRIVTMAILLYLVMGFALTNAAAFLHIGHRFRKAVSGLSDDQFRVLAHNKLLDGFRQEMLGRLVRCHACAGFWIGSLLSLLHGGFIVEYMRVNSTVEQVVGDGLLLSGSNFILWVLLRWFKAEEL